ncbi:MAG: hypothetical protein JSU74_11805 [Candidatus Zixiibacteriota bacterium]|nr:MAG: hypothetical protein JSU74_11805 [candidate division Zixibacteria bacterium]
MRKHRKTILLVLPALLIYAYFCYGLNFTQDDAYISYRYVANFLDGHGLVYNIGERIEGFTNFGWVIYMILWGALGLGYIAVSKITGFLFGAGIIVLTLLVAQLIFHGRDSIFGWVAVCLVGINQSLAYWSPAGLETAAFSFFAFFSLFLFMKRNWLLVFTLTVAVLLRPEGALVAFILVVIEAIETRRVPLFAGGCALAALLVLLPMLGFKFLYYGSILPNPFYAKTALTADRLIDGLEYTGRFLGHYGFYGIGLVVPFLFYRKISPGFRAVLLFSVIYMVYIVGVGGDVLKVHRFFLPLIGVNAVLLSGSAWLAFGKLRKNPRMAAIVLSAVLLLVGTFALPRKFVLEYNMLERAFTHKMGYLADRMAATDPTNFSVALSTIGIFGYRLPGHHIIDMLGLTDSTVARHPEPHAVGMTSTWKERKYNSGYILSLQPDYIMFSTGMKPSAPAEKSLLLYRSFLECYRGIGWVLDEEEATLKSAVLGLAFKKFRPFETAQRPTYPLAFVEYFKSGIESYRSGNQRRAIELFDRAIEVSPRPAYIYLPYHKAISYAVAKQHDRSVALLDSVIAVDSLLFMAHARLYKYALAEGNNDKAAIHRDWLARLVPWYLPRVEAQAEAMMRGRAAEAP